MNASLLPKLRRGAIEAMRTHSLPVVAVAGVLAIAGFAWWWISGG